MRIVFVRHGDPDYENDTLTELGHRQAALAAERLKEEGIEEIWASTMGRATQTAEYASKALGLPVKPLDCMRELNWGGRDGGPAFADGHPWDIADEIARQGENLGREDWRNHPYFVNNRVLDSVRTVEEGIDEWLAGYGYIRRGYGYFHTAAEERHRTVALFSHGGSSCAAMGHILNIPFPQMCGMLHLAFTGITILRLDRNAGPGTQPCLELGNDGKHIRESLVWDKRQSL